ncbi:TRAP transporter permease [Caenispirillum bisanense]|uniref:TRAP transporter, 4TM/12TM fusion protein n=1 Tax=Caenispirillum bisanense TaxID=414052 RepID=A0A286G8N5_9PROT|nr:TRAP transporter permease [Caenispirillum bisanense]SOD91858.1 TRAP transporter, 4TM/12TM fusion protein [Caenispirillum bisanense]
MSLEAPRPPHAPSRDAGRPEMVDDQGFHHISAEQADELVRKYDNEVNFRRLTGSTGAIATVACIAISLFHVYTAGFGLLNEVMHRSVHMSFILPLVFLFFPRQKGTGTPRAWGFGLAFAAFYMFLAWQLVDTLSGQVPDLALWGLMGVVGIIALTALPIRALGGLGDRLSVVDWPLAVAGMASSLYLVVFFEDIFIANAGFPSPLDYIMGLLAIVMVLEAARRTMGETLPVIGTAALLYAVLGPYLPGMLAHRGYDIIRMVNHLYLGTEGIYGVAIGVVATYVFHFVLFGVLAQASGLGQLFIELATILAGRYSGGPAKVSVVSSGFFGMISGSPIANTVTTGAFTIPMMIRKGFSPKFAAAVEASSSCGGQVTPPIMGASAFVMTEMLGIPYNELILIAIVPAAFHYLATLCMVHLEARRLGLEGMSKDQIPQILDVLKRSWHLLIPLVAMVTLLLMQYTPFLSAFWGIILTVVCSYIPLLTKALKIGSLDTSSVLTPHRLKEGLVSGAQHSIAITAACACVGFILGVTTLTGLGFKFSGAVIQLAEATGLWLSAVDPTGTITTTAATLFVGLLLVGLACIVMGAGIPTTPTYIILASIAAPALNELGVPLVATHFFVFYYGVLADVTPPVALAAYAGAGISGSDPMRTGLTAFRLSMGKALVPFMFIYAPSLLFVDFTWSEFLLALGSGITCIVALSAAYIGYFKTTLGTLDKVLLTLAGLVLVGSNPWAVAAAGTVVVVVLGRNTLLARRAALA